MIEESNAYWFKQLLSIFCRKISALMSITFLKPLPYTTFRITGAVSWTAQPEVCRLIFRHNGNQFSTSTVVQSVHLKEAYENAKTVAEN